jgi:hypothetical protein
LNSPSSLSKTPKEKKKYAAKKTEVRANKRGGNVEQRHLANDRRRDEVKRG